MNEIRKKNNQVLGFGKTIESKKESFRITSHDLIQYGLIPELVGRFSNIIELSDLSKENLIQIMKNPYDDLLNSELHILELEGIKVHIDEKVYEQLADHAIEKKIGARGLIGEVNALFIKAMGEIAQNRGIYKELIIDERTIENPKAYKLVKKK